MPRSADADRSAGAPAWPAVASLARTALCLVAAVVVLTACEDSTKRALGLTRSVPDEFAVVKRAPLSQPPDYTLRPPRPGAERPGVASPRQQARQAVFRGDEPAAARADGAPAARRGAGPAPAAAPQGQVSQRSAGESAFLARAGADSVEPDIRLKVDRESALLAEADLNFVQKLLDYKPNVDDVVDAPAEARRLRENQALGRPPTEGDTPLIERKSNSLFNIF